MQHHRLSCTLANSGTYLLTQPTILILALCHLPKTLLSWRFPVLVNFGQHFLRTMETMQSFGHVLLVFENVTASSKGSIARS